MKRQTARISVVLGLCSGVLGAAGCFEDSFKGETGGEDSGAVSGGDTSDSAVIPPGEPVAFTEVAGGFDVLGDGEEWDCAAPEGGDCCTELNILLVTDIEALETVFAAELDGISVPEVDFADAEALLSYSSDCALSPNNLEVDRVYANGDTLYVFETLYRPSDVAQQDRSRPFNVISMNRGPDALVVAELSEVFVALSERDWH